MSTLSFPSVKAGALTLILGLGETGVAAALWCIEHGARLRVLDTRAQPSGLETLREQIGNAAVDYRLGPDSLTEDALQDVQRIVISPGLSPLLEPVKGFLAIAEQREIEVIGEIELFALALADMANQGYKPQLVAITGTNGKTTVTAMVRQLVQAGGRTAQVAGNISPAALTALRQAIQTNNLPQVWVLELSSFQLQATKTLTPDAAVVLNLTQDHLDWHGSMQAYAAAKAKLLQAATITVVNRDDPAVATMVPDLKALTVRSFGLGVPKLVGDLGLEVNHDLFWLCVNEADDFDLSTAQNKRKKLTEAVQRQAGHVVRLMPTGALRVRGMHNALNALAALALARSLGLGWADMLHALRDYCGEPNRTEFVRTVRGVDFVNDSKGTNVGATVAALEGLGQKVVLIAGGLGKGQDFSSLAGVVRQHARAVVLMGQDASTIADALTTAGVPIEYVDSMDQAVNRSFTLAQSGDAVLLSPACASMDMFKNYKHRGAVFVESVNDLALELGEVA